MDTALTGAISLPHKYLRNQLADCTEFRLATGSQTREEALRSIYDWELPPPANHRDEHQAAERENLRPCAIIYPVEERNIVFSRIADYDYGESGQLVISLEWDIPESISRDVGEVARQFQRFVGRIVRRTEEDEQDLVGLLDLAYQAGYLAIDRIRFKGPYRVDPSRIAAQGDYAYGWLIVEWGLSERGG